MSNVPTCAEASSPQRGNKVLGFIAKTAELSENIHTPHDDWVDLVRRIQAGQTEGLNELYQFFSKGMRFYLCRHTGPQDLNDRLHDLFILVVQAIRRREIREPERLMGFVRTVAQRQIAAYIDRTIDARKKTVALQFGSEISAFDPTPEQAAIFRQREELVRNVLAELSERDREILRRFYVEEQSAAEVCSQMELTETQFRLLKSRAKARFGELGKKKLVSRQLGAARYKIRLSQTSSSSSNGSWTSSRPN